MQRLKKILIRNRKGAVKSIAREHYLRDISCGSPLCRPCVALFNQSRLPSEYTQPLHFQLGQDRVYLIPDLSVCLAQTDLLEHPAIKNLIFCESTSSPATMPSALQAPPPPFEELMIQGLFVFFFVFFCFSFVCLFSSSPFFVVVTREKMDPLSFPAVFCFAFCPPLSLFFPATLYPFVSAILISLFPFSFSFPRYPLPLPSLLSHSCLLPPCVLPFH